MTSYQQPADSQVPPSSPPAAPVIPLGFASKLGVYSTAVLGIAALVSAVLEGDHSAETLTALAGAVITLATTLAGRFAQAYAIYRDRPGLGSVVEGIQIMRAPLEPPEPPVPPGLAPSE